MQFCVEQMQTVTFYGMLRNVSTNYEWKSHGFCVCVFSTFQQCGTVHVLEEASVQASLTSETGDFQENILLETTLESPSGHDCVVSVHNHQGLYTLMM